MVRILRIQLIFGVLCVFSLPASASPCRDSVHVQRAALSQEQFRIWRMEFYQTPFGKECLAEIRADIIDTTKSNLKPKPQTKKRKEIKKEGKK